MQTVTEKTILQNPFLNKGTAFSLKERDEFGLTGLLPSAVQTLEEQEAAAYAKVQTLPDAYTKQLYLMNIYDSNRVLFFHLVGQHITELLPIIYTPTIADAVMNYSANYENPQGAVFLSIDQPKNIRAALQIGSKDLEDVKLMVITDGEGVLGIGDWGIQGVSISIGKLAVYTVASGLDPRQVMPVVIDAGTNNEQLLKDPLYLGNRHERIRGEQYDTFIDQFIQEAAALFPDVLFHWEDFGRDNAAKILTKYREKICTFNDDIQGTGIMMAAAMESVVQITKTPLSQQKILVFGAGTAGVGIANQILSEMTLQGTNEKEAIKRFYLVDRYGLITEDMDDLTEGQQKFARPVSEIKEPIRHLTEAVEVVRPNVIIGTSGQAGAFTEEVVKKMADYNERPAILPISNPSHLCEAKAEDIIRWSGGRALVVTGSPSEPVDYNGVTYTIGQANNALLYPGLGFGIVTAKAKTVTDNMLSAAAHGITSLQDLEKPGAALLPHVKKLREASKLVASAVVKAAIEDGVNQAEIDSPEAVVEAAIWEPIYK